MSHPEICTDPLKFDPNDPYVRDVYLGVLNMLLDATPDDEGLAGRIREQEQQARTVLGSALGTLVVVQAIIDDLDIRIPEPSCGIGTLDY